jgi:hypothetical protein
MLDLRTVRKDVLEYCESLLDQEGPYGCYRSKQGGRPDLYASCDIAEIRTIMGEDLTLLPEEQRRQWIDHINSFTDLFHKDGRYTDTYGHSLLHANGMVVGALAALGGRQQLPVRLYDEFNTADKVGAWLEQIDWVNQWRASHLFWGGMHCFSFSKTCQPDWLNTVFDWLDRNLDEQTGWWRKGIPHADRHQPLGGSVHILPVYQHHGRTFPYPEKVIDSVLGLQLPSGRWLKRDGIHIMSYLELDALYALLYMRQLAPDYRSADIMDSVSRYGSAVIEYYRNHKSELFQLHPHPVLAAVGTFGLLNAFLPDTFPDEVQWTDIFSDVRFYNTASVEV